MTEQIGSLDVELVKWLDTNKKKIVFRFGEEGGELYVEDKEKKK